MDVRMPDGYVLRNVPEGTQKDAIMQKYTQWRVQRMQALDKPVSAVDGMSRGERVAAGAGKAVFDLARGAGQLVGAVSPEDIAVSRRIDAPLMATTGAKVGNFLGNVAAAVPAAFVPGANTAVGAGVIGAGLGLLQPAMSGGERAANTVLGGALGAGGQKVGQAVGQRVGAKIAERTAAAADDKAANAVRDATLKDARKVGYVVPPSTPNPTVVNRVSESISGKAATQQSATVKNQRITNTLVREELGLKRNVPLTRQTLEGIRKQAGGVYRAIKSSGDIASDDQYLTELIDLTRSADDIVRDFPDLSVAGAGEIKALQDGMLRDRFSANSALELVKKLRDQASGNLAWNVDDPGKKALGLAQREAAGIVEDQLLRHLRANGNGALATQFDGARKLIAKTYSVQAALNEGTGNVVATKLGSQLRKGKPLSGRFETIAKFAESFPKAAGEQTTSPGVSAVDALIAIGGGATVDPTLIALPLARIGARSALLSNPAQNAMAMPSYAPRNALLEGVRRGSRFGAPVAIGLGNSE